MCQVTPFTLPCCRRIYVSVDRLPSCPDGWPKKKCPRELCVQISGFEPKDVDNRNTGICWRCLAWHKDMGPYARETLRPVLDKAFIVEGLGDISIEERRVKMEKAGICWHCGAHGDCVSCGTVIEAGKGKDSTLDGWDHRGQKRAAEADMGQGRNKVVKVEHARASMPTLTSAFPAPSSIAMAPTGYPAQPFGQLSRDPSPQYHFNSGQNGYDQFHQPALTSHYQGQQMTFQTPLPQGRSGNWQEAQGFQNHAVPGVQDRSVPVDPTLSQPPKEEESTQPINPAPPQSQLELPHLPTFDTTWIDAELHATNGSTFESMFSSYNNVLQAQDLKNETDSSESVFAPLVDQSVGQMMNEYPAPS